MKDDGGYVNPQPTGEYGNGVPLIKGGKTLLDDFAGQALMGTASNSKDTWETFEEEAKWCYDIAEAMIKEKRKREK